MSEGGQAVEIRTAGFGVDRGQESEVLKLRAQLRHTEEERDILKKGRAVLCKPARVKYQFIIEHRDQYKVATMCRVLRASRSGFYA